MSLVGELQRRNVIRIAIAYLAASWLLIQIAHNVEDGEPASTHYDMASVFHIVGDLDAAFSELEKAVERSYPHIRFDDVLFSTMHDDPRYDVLMEKAGMPREKMEAIQFEAPIPSQ